MKGCRPLSDQELELALSGFQGRYDARDRALFILGTRSGFRVSELLSIRIKQIQQNGKILDRIHVNRKDMKKKMEGRSVVLHPQAREAVRLWLEELLTLKMNDPDMFLFQSQKGGNKPISRVQAFRILQDAFAFVELNGKLGTHCMRKTFANNVYDKLDHDLIRTQRALGHKNINSTVQYMSFREEEIDIAILSQ